MTKSLLVLCMLTAFSIGGRVEAAPPIPFLDDNETGINMVFSGDPDTTIDGDANNDGVVDVSDLGILDCGAIAVPDAGVAISGGVLLVPEPATGMVLAVSVVCLGCRRW